jgi:hypothetical protein
MTPEYMPDYTGLNTGIITRLCPNSWALAVTVELNKKWNTSFFCNAAAGNSDLVSQNIFWSAGVKF